MLIEGQPDGKIKQLKIPHVHYMGPGINLSEAWRSRKVLEFYFWKNVQTLMFGLFSPE